MRFTPQQRPEMKMVRKIEHVLHISTHSANHVTTERKKNENLLKC